MDLFKKKVAIVTGGASGIGRALCEELGRRGAVVVVADVNAKGAEQVVSSILRAGEQARAVHLDVSRREDVEKVIDDTVKAYGRLDYMFNNAGIAIGGDVRDLSLEHWQKTIDVNLWGVLYGTIAAYSLMARQGFGYIVNTASLAGLVPGATEAAYATTKYAVVGLSRSLRIEGADLGVKVSVVCPGFIKTNIFETFTLLKVKREDLLAKVPFKMMDATKAARAILHGVARNQEIIVFPFHARFLWWLDRRIPALSALMWRKGLKDFRALRGE